MKESSGTVNYNDNNKKRNLGVIHCSVKKKKLYITEEIQSVRKNITKERKKFKKNMLSLGLQIIIIWKVNFLIMEISKLVPNQSTKVGDVWVSHLLVMVLLLPTRGICNSFISCLSFQKSNMASKFRGIWVLKTMINEDWMPFWNPFNLGQSQKMWL